MLRSLTLARLDTLPAYNAGEALRLTNFYTKRMSVSRNIAKIGMFVGLSLWALLHERPTVYTGHAVVISMHYTEPLTTEQDAANKVLLKTCIQKCMSSDFHPELLNPVVEFVVKNPPLRQGTRSETPKLKHDLKQLMISILHKSKVDPELHRSMTIVMGLIAYGYYDEALDIISKELSDQRTKALDDTKNMPVLVRGVATKAALAICDGKEGLYKRIRPSLITSKNVLIPLMQELCERQTHQSAIAANIKYVLPAGSK